MSRLAQEIVRQIDRKNSIWTKWDSQREIVARLAVGCWVPNTDLRDFLNSMPGPHLTTTDVAQRLKALEEEDYAHAIEELQPGCLMLYEKEKAEGTDLPAILGLLRDHVQREEERLRVEQQKRHQQLREQERTALEGRLLSGADCKWIQLQKSPHWFCRTNGRTYRLLATKDKMWNLHRVNSPSIDEKGALIGKYQRRRDATKVVAQIAYQPELKW